MGRERHDAWGPFSDAERVGTFIGWLLVIFGMGFGGVYVVLWLINN